LKKYENELRRAARFRIFSTLVLVGSWRQSDPPIKGKRGEKYENELL